MRSIRSKWDPGALVAIHKQATVWKYLFRLAIWAVEQIGSGRKCFPKCTCPFVKCFPCESMSDARLCSYTSRLQFEDCFKHALVVIVETCSSFGLCTILFPTEWVFDLRFWRCRGWSSFPGKRLRSAQTGSFWWSASCRRVFQTCACGKCASLFLLVAQAQTRSHLKCVSDRRL